jgi:hypothetical protein
VDALSWLSTQANSPTTRVISGLVSLGLLFFISLGILGVLPISIPTTLMFGALSFLGVHLLNQLYFSIETFKIHVCHKCGEILKPITVTTYPKHTCKKRDINKVNTQ